MDKLKQLALISGKQQWLQYREAVRKELLADRQDKSILVEFPSEPVRYPCLAASSAKFDDITQPGSFARIVVSCCYVYLEDAQYLLDKAKQANPNWHPVISAKIEEDDDYDAEYDEYNPTGWGTLTLALLLELKEIGALKLDKLTQRMSKVHDWLESQEETGLADSDTVEIVEKLWGATDVG